MATTTNEDTYICGKCKGEIKIIKLEKSINDKWVCIECGEEGIIIKQNYMNRIIKFRIWDNKSQKMYNNPVVSNYSYYLDDYHYNNDVSNKDIPKGQFLMQFTGLLDKNGKEIYEGDIVKGMFEAVNEVEWQNCGFRPFANDYFGDSGYSPEECEVIGNIYENKNLLNKNI